MIPKYAIVAQALRPVNSVVPLGKLRSKLARMNAMEVHQRKTRTRKTPKSNLYRLMTYLYDIELAGGKIEKIKEGRQIVAVKMTQLPKTMNTKGEVVQAVDWGTGKHAKAEAKAKATKKRKTAAKLKAKAKAAAQAEKPVQGDVKPEGNNGKANTVKTKAKPEPKQTEQVAQAAA